METHENDYDRIAMEVVGCIGLLLGNAHAPTYDDYNSMTITQTGFLKALIRLQRLNDWVEGLAESHRSMDDHGNV